MSRPPSIETLRKRIAALQAERAELESQTRSRAEVVTTLEGLIAQWSAMGAATIARELERLALGQPAEPLTMRKAVPVGAAPGVAPVSVNFGPLMVALLGADAVKSALMGFVQAIPEGVPTAQRLARLAEIGEELDRLESEEESMVVASGGTIERRANARPEIILGCEA